MAHFAQIAGDTVTQVIVVSNDDCGNLEFPESEPVGQEFIASIGLTGEWKQTSYNNNFRGRYAGIGFRYDRQLDEFVQPIQTPVTIEPEV
jgi:hypothetical protein